MSISDEEWRPVPGFPGYQASSQGRIRSDSGCVLTGTPATKGHKQVNVKGARGRVTVAVHHLVALAFLGPTPPGHLVVHLNGDKLDCRPSNLKVMTPAQNVRHASTLGLSWPTQAQGEKNPNAKLNPEKVRQMRALRQQGVSFTELGRMFGVTERAARRVVRRQDWRHVA